MAINNAMFASSKDRFDRVSICQACDQYLRSTRQCRMCGCLVSVKIAWADSECPLDKWSSVPGGHDPVSQIVRFFKKTR